MNMFSLDLYWTSGGHVKKVVGYVSLESGRGLGERYDFVSHPCTCGIHIHELVE